MCWQNNKQTHHRTLFTFTGVEIINIFFLNKAAEGVEEVIQPADLHIQLTCDLLDQTPGTNVYLVM